MTLDHARVWMIRCRTDLLALVPYLLEYHPDDSLLVVTFTGNRLTFIARADLPAADATATTVRAIVTSLADVVTPHEPTAVVLIGYGPTRRVAVAIDAAREIFPRRGVEVGEALRLTDGRYFSYLCTDSTCCPPEGTAFDPATNELAAQAVLAGQIALPNRAALANRLAPVDGTDCHAMQRATDRAKARLTALRDRAGSEPGEPPSTRNEGQKSPTARIAAMVQNAGEWAVWKALGAAEAGTQLTDDEAAWLSLLLTNVRVRDFAFTRTRGHDQHVRLWTDLTRRA